MKFGISLRLKQDRSTAHNSVYNWRFYQKSSDDMSELKDGEVQTIFTSPPYWNKRLYLNKVLYLYTLRIRFLTNINVIKTWQKVKVLV